MAIAKKDAKHTEKKTIRDEAKLMIYLGEDKVGQLAYMTNYYIQDEGKKERESRPYRIINANTKKIVRKWDGLTTHKVRVYRHTSQSLAFNLPQLAAARNVLTNWCL